MERVRGERRARVGPCSAPRRGSAGDVDADHDADDEERVPRRLHGGAVVDEADYRAPDNHDTGDDEDRALRERGEMLRLAVAVLVAGIGGANGVAEGVTGQQRRIEFCTVINSL